MSDLTDGPKAEASNQATTTSTKTSSVNQTQSLNVVTNTIQTTISTPLHNRNLVTDEDVFGCWLNTREKVNTHEHLANPLSADLIPRVHPRCERQ
jgi:hypothetical protein